MIGILTAGSGVAVGEGVAVAVGNGVGVTEAVGEGSGVTVRVAVAVALGVISVGTIVCVGAGVVPAHPARMTANIKTARQR